MVSTWALWVWSKHLNGCDASHGLGPAALSAHAVALWAGQEAAVSPSPAPRTARTRAVCPDLLLFLEAPDLGGCHAGHFGVCRVLGWELLTGELLVRCCSVGLSSTEYRLQYRHVFLFCSVA